MSEEKKRKREVLIEDGVKRERYEGDDLWCVVKGDD